jgi:thiol:disulfide interchange protein DsbA
MRKLLGLVVALCMTTGLALVPVSTALSDEFNVEGKYKRITPARTLGETNKVEVIDVFWYGCPHCFSFLPHLQQWEATSMPDYVELRRVPAIFRDSWAVHARAYYTARVLGMDHELHNTIFAAMHDEKRPLNTREELQRFFSEHGVDSTEFDTTYDSFTVDAMTRESQVMPRRWGVQATPSVIVNGRYLISGRTAGSYADMIKVLEVLVAREQQAMAAQAQS